MPGRTGTVYEFGLYRLDPEERLLLRGGEPLVLRAKIFDTLCALVNRHGQLVRKEELMQAVWPDIVVEEGNLAHNLSTLRKLLARNDPAKYIETVPGHGYRFVAEVREVAKDTKTCPRPAPVSVVPPRFLIQRHEETARLERCFDDALRGSRQIVFVTGEAGMGKSTLVEAFVARARQRALLWFGQGQCVALRGEGEAYLPVFDALAHICRESGAGEGVSLLTRAAPAWVAQMPWLLEGEQLAAIQQRIQGATKDRLLREIAETFGLLSEIRPVLLVLEDLHWSDYSTVDLLAYLARRQAPARLMLVGTFRSSGTRITAHPLHRLIQELVGRGLCQEVALSYFSAAAVEECLVRRFPRSRFPAGMAALLHRRTGGNPLFVSDVINHWLARGAVARSGDAWCLTAPLEDLERTVPESLRLLIEREWETVGTEEQELLEAASVAGANFPVAAVALAIERPAEEVEACCEKLARQGHFLLPSGAAEWPEGVTAVYAFQHDLEREVVYDRIPPARRARLHGALGSVLESAYGDQANERAAELAVHFVEARDGLRAAEYLRLAAEQALSRSAHREAVDYLQTALRSLRSVAEGPSRAQIELSLHALLAPAMIALQGWRSTQAEDSYRRAGEICAQLPDPELRSTVYVGLATLWEVRGDYPRSQALIEESLCLSPGGRPQDLRVESHELLACSLFHQGSFDLALDHARRALSEYDPGRNYPLLAAYGDSPAVACHDWAALSLWFLGYPDRAVEESLAALRHAEQRPHSLATAYNQAAILYQCRREPEQVRSLATRAIHAAQEYGFPYRAAVGKILYGWALAALGACGEGLAELLGGLAACRATGAEMDDAYYLALLAEAHLFAGRPEEALYPLAEALAAVRDDRGFFYSAELHRLWGRTLLQAGIRCLDDAEAGFVKALEVARRQKARCLELRAVTSLARLRSPLHSGSNATSLAEVYSSFTEGWDTADLIEARMLMASGFRPLVASTPPTALGVNPQA